MESSKVLAYVKSVIGNMPEDWLSKTTHRLDVYNEERAKFDFLEGIEKLYKEGDFSSNSLKSLPTAFDYIRLGHPLSCLLEWAIARSNNLESKYIISFSSKTMPILAVLRKNALSGKGTRIIYQKGLPQNFDIEVLNKVYGYSFELNKVEKIDEVSEFEGSTVFICQDEDFSKLSLNENIDFLIKIHPSVGSVIAVNGERNQDYISEIQHVRRRETVAMTPSDSFFVLKSMVGESLDGDVFTDKDKEIVLKTINKVTNTNSKALLSSSGLSIQYAIVMGLIDDAFENHKGKEIKIIVPPNCYGGTNDQARRVASCVEGVEVLDLPVDGGKDMVQSIDQVLSEVSETDAVPLIIAEIPTNPRVEVPDLIRLKNVLSLERKTKDGGVAVDPIFILDQTFCPNVHFLGEDDILSSVRTISYVSGSKFPSGGLCTAGYSVANKKASYLTSKIEKHLKICDNEATNFQMKVLANQMPEMNKRIEQAYKNTREFVDFISKVLPEAKINFVSEELADKGFTPSVFSLDLPMDGKTEAYKREMNHRLIGLMIDEIPEESQHCVSYGQLKGCYWTIPATSTQGTTKEGDKDYIVRVSASPDMNVMKHKEVFMKFLDLLNE